jgi:hypothetical protein
MSPIASHSSCVIIRLAFKAPVAKESGNAFNNCRDIGRFERITGEREWQEKGKEGR